MKEHGVAVSITEVVGISIPDVTGAFAKVVKLLSDAGENVEYAYAFLTPEEGHAYVIFRVDNNEKLASTLRKTASMLSKKTLCCNSISLKPGAVASGFSANLRTFLIYFFIRCDKIFNNKIVGR